MTEIEQRIAEIIAEQAQLEVAAFKTWLNYGRFRDPVDCSIGNTFCNRRRIRYLFP